MESGSKALIMVASVLLAMIVIAFMTFSFNRMGTWATAQDDEILIEQTDKFNQEFEAYGKDLMYGVDVISCLNKAKSNNDKIEDERMVNGEKYDAIYKVEVTFKLKSPLTEAVRVYHAGANGRPVEYLTDKPNESKVKVMNDIFTISNEYKSKVQGGSRKIDFSKKLAPYPDGSTQINAGTYSLINNYAVVEALLTCSNELKQTVKNKKPDASDRDGWTMAVWETALFDMKTRKFTCTNIAYNAQTARINRMDFEEY